MNLKLNNKLYNTTSFSLIHVTEPPSLTLNPFIKHWEIAKFDRSILEEAHQHHVGHHRRKRDINYNHKSTDYGPANVIRFKFYAHDR